MGFFDFFKKKDDFDDLDIGLSSNTQLAPQSTNINQNQSAQNNPLQPSLQSSVQSSTVPNSPTTFNQQSLSQNSSPNQALDSQMQQPSQFNSQMHSFQNSIVSSVNDFNSSQNQYSAQYQGINESSIELIKKDMQLIMEKLNTLKIMLDGIDARLRKLEQIAENEQKKPRYF